MTEESGQKKKKKKKGSAAEEHLKGCGWGTWTSGLQQLEGILQMLKQESCFSLALD